MRFTDTVAGHMKAGDLLRLNIDALLRARHQTRHDLAQWCRNTDGWLSKILGKDARNLPLKYLDRMADFFGLAPYQLFQPGISPLTERRHSDRRSGRDRRISAINHRVRESVSTLVATLSPADVADVIRMRGLSEAARDAVRRAAMEAEKEERRRKRTRGPRTPKPPPEPPEAAGADE
jgi:hypothetical protein